MPQAVANVPLRILTSSWCQARARWARSRSLLPIRSSDSPVEQAARFHIGWAKTHAGATRMERAGTIARPTVLS